MAELDESRYHSGYESKDPFPGEDWAGRAFPLSIEKDSRHQCHKYTKERPEAPQIGDHVS